jgi:hypothetical protein
MNERIKELHNRACRLDMEQYPNAIPDGERIQQKFAELIVQECITIVDEQKECLHEEQQYWHDRDYGYEMAVNDASKGIKQFFGVEE